MRERRTTHQDDATPLTTQSAITQPPVSVLIDTNAFNIVYSDAGFLCRRTLVVRMSPPVIKKSNPVDAFQEFAWNFADRFADRDSPTCQVCHSGPPRQLDNLTGVRLKSKQKCERNLAANRHKRHKNGGRGVGLPSSQKPLCFCAFCAFCGQSSSDPNSATLRRPSSAADGLPPGIETHTQPDTAHPLTFIDPLPIVQNRRRGIPPPEFRSGVLTAWRSVD